MINYHLFDVLSMDTYKYFKRTFDFGKHVLLGKGDFYLLREYCTKIFNYTTISVNLMNTRGLQIRDVDALCNKAVVCMY